MSLKYEPASEPLHIYASFLARLLSPPPPNSSATPPTRPPPPAQALHRVPTVGTVCVVTPISGSKAGSYLRLIDSCITPLKAQGPSRTCNESKEEEEEDN